MGQIPRFQASPEGVPSGAGTNIKMPMLDDPQRAMAELGQNTEKIGLYFAEAQIKTDTIKHRSEFERYLSDYSRTFPLEADVRGTDDIKHFDAQVKGRRGAILMGIRNGKTRQLVDAEFDELERRYRTHTLQTLRAKQVSIGQGEMVESLFNARRLAAASPDDGSRGVIKAQASLDIDQYVKAGIISAEEGAKQKLQFKAGVAEDNVLALLNAGDIEAAREAANDPDLPAAEKVRLAHKIDSKEEVDIRRREADDRRKEAEAMRADKAVKEANALQASVAVLNGKMGIKELTAFADNRGLDSGVYRALMSHITTEGRRDADDDPLTRAELTMLVASRATPGEINTAVLRAIKDHRLSSSTASTLIMAAGDKAFADGAGILTRALAPGAADTWGETNLRNSAAYDEWIGSIKRGEDPRASAGELVNRTVGTARLPRYIIPPKTFPVGAKVDFEDPQFPANLKIAGERAVLHGTPSDMKNYSALRRAYEDYLRIKADDEAIKASKKGNR